MMVTIKQLVENKQKLDYPAICQALMERFSVPEPVNWNSVLPVPQQQELFGGEVLRLISDYEADHIKVANQKDIRPISLMKGSVSQMLFFFTRLNDASLPKKQIEQITKRFKKGPEANRFIVWFFGNKDSTQLKVVLSAREGKKIVLKTLPFGVNQPYYKTYNFILDEVASKVNRLFIEPTELWKALWSAFDISIVNRKFYDEIKKVFTALIEDLNAKGNPFQSDEDRVQFAIRLIGRIIFCWFLKRKQIIREEALSSSAARHYIDGDYYHDLLEILFFEVMNKPEKERIGGLPKLIAHYPFLNGGLFDAQESDFYKNKPDFRIRIDNKWFFDFFGETLEKYNFTVDENSSSSAEIAIDPEMLGRIFENLLAEQNPDTGESARKATGSFYTPREIVEYMVEQSITEFLKTSLGIGNDEPELEKNLFGTVPNQQLKIPQPKAVSGLGEAVEDMVHTNHLPDELKPYAQKLLNALNEIKVLDPACGSGAFPMGVLQKLIALKQEILQAQNPKKQFTDAVIYQLKLDTIQNSIYGVDIQPMAVELSRLRCWLSLVVDEEIDNIKPLPNLDFKFVCANTLVDVPLTDYRTDELDENLKELEKNVEQYFSPDFRNKKKIKNGIRENILAIERFHHKVIGQFLDKMRKEGKTASPNRMKQLQEEMSEYLRMDAKWKSYENIFENKKVDFFNPVFFFPSAKKGFDIVIGNPPYGVSVKNEYRSEVVESLGKVPDFEIYYFFFEVAKKLLKESGVLSYITPNTFLFNVYAKNYRLKLLAEWNIFLIVDCTAFKIFENAMVLNAVTFLKKGNFSLPVGYKNTLNINNFLNLIQLPTEHITKEELSSNNVNWGLAFKLGKTTLGVVSKIRMHKEAISNYPEISQGLIAYDKYRGQSKEIIESRAYHSLTYKKGYKKWLWGEDVTRYNLKWNGQEYINYCKGIANPREPKYFTKPRVLVREITNPRIFAAYTEDEYYNDPAVINILGNSKNDLKYLLGILNSKLATFFHFNASPKATKGAFPKILVEDIKKFPLPFNSANQRNTLAALVGSLQFSLEFEDSLNEYVPNEHIAKQFDELIDGCVYELYFYEKVKEKEADVLQLVSEQFTSIEGLPKPEQIELIKKGYQILRDSHSEIRSRLTRQKLVEEIAIINSSLQ